jgi:diaminopimelate decarboxylase
MTLTNERYHIDGLDVLDICGRYGTPLYVYETAKMKSQYDRMIRSFSVPKLRVFYACKALTNINILRFFQCMGAGLDAVSIQEVMLGLRAGFAPSDIMFTPNGISTEEIEAAVDLGVKINIDNIPMLEHCGHRYAGSVPFGIRINPHIEVGTHEKVSVGHIDSKFGISIHQLPHVLRITEATGLNVAGLHMHTGSEILDVEVFLEAAEILLQAARRLTALDYLDFGSGFKVTYKSDDEATDVPALGREFSARFRKFCDDYGKELALIFEPGKFLVSEAGYFLARVNVVKHTTSAVFAGVDSGFNHFVRPMLYDAYHHIVNISNPKGRQKIYSIVGYICETDTFAWNRKVEEIREGDILCFLNAGAYGFMMSSNYNLRPRPPEVLIHNGKDYLISEREDFDDLVDNMVDHSSLFQTRKHDSLPTAQEG